MDREKFYAKCLQGNVLEAIDSLKSSEDKGEDLLEMERKYVHRFIAQDEIFKIDSEDSWIRAVIKCYDAYFVSVLTNRDAIESERRLTAGLAKILKEDHAADLNEIEAKLEPIFKEKGYSFLGGKTAPYWGPYIWKTTKKEDFHVELPCESRELTVFFISDFLMLSWLHFATFGKHYAGGWAKKDGIYYVNADHAEVDTSSADFQVWFLKHEAQHLSDFARYPDLRESVLEYRAKLVELIYYPNPLDRLKVFISQSKDEKSLPHPYAAFRIVKGLSNALFGEEFVGDMKKWKTLNPAFVSKAARELFMRDEQMLRGKTG